MNENLSAPSLEKPSLQDIQNKIKLLSTYQDTDLESAMTDLKKGLHLNPEACNLIMPEEIGEMVKYLMKIEGKIIVEAQNKEKMKKEKKEKPVGLTPEQLEQMADEM